MVSVVGAVLIEAGNADSGHPGHKGIPGQRGGSLPAGFPMCGFPPEFVGIALDRFRDAIESKILAHKIIPDTARQNSFSILAAQITSGLRASDEFIKTEGDQFALERAMLPYGVEYAKKVYPELKAQVVSQEGRFQQSVRDDGVIVVTAQRKGVVSGDQSKEYFGEKGALRFEDNFSSEGAKYVADEAARAISSGLAQGIILRSSNGTPKAIAAVSQSIRPSTMYIEWLASAEKGYGTRAMQEIVKTAHKQGYLYVDLTSLKTARGFYQKIGMTEVETLSFRASVSDLAKRLEVNLTESSISEIVDSEPEDGAFVGIINLEEGGPGSGHPGHRGIPGQKGGSLPGGGGYIALGHVGEVWSPAFTQPPVNTATPGSPEYFEAAKNSVTPEEYWMKELLEQQSPKAKPGVLSAEELEAKIKDGDTPVWVKDEAYKRHPSGVGIEVSLTPIDGARRGLIDRNAKQVIESEWGAQAKTTLKEERKVSRALEQDIKANGWSADKAVKSAAYRALAYDSPSLGALYRGHDVMKPDVPSYGWTEGLQKQTGIALVLNPTALWLESNVAEAATLRSIINLTEEGTSDSGHRGHRGIPGYKGGSLPASGGALGWGLPKDETLAKHPEWIPSIINVLEQDIEKLKDPLQSFVTTDITGVLTLAGRIRDIHTLDAETGVQALKSGISYVNDLARFNELTVKTLQIQKGTRDAKNAYDLERAAAVQKHGELSDAQLRKKDPELARLKKEWDEQADINKAAYDKFEQENGLNKLLTTLFTTGPAELNQLLALAKTRNIETTARQLDSQFRPATPEEQATYENRRLTPVQPMKMEKRDPSTAEGIKAAISDYEGLIKANGGKPFVLVQGQWIDLNMTVGQLKSLANSLTMLRPEDRAQWVPIITNSVAKEMSGLQSTADAVAMGLGGKVLVNHLDKVAVQAQSAFDAQHAKMLAAGQKPQLDTYKDAKHVGDDLAPEGMFSGWDKAGTRAASRAAGGNNTLREIQHYQGFDGPAKIVPSHIFDEMATKESMYVVYRGLHSQQRTYEVRFGAHYPGLGIYGDGTYTSPERSYTNSYTKDTGQMRMALAPGSKIVQYGDLNNRYNAEKAKPGADKHPELDDTGSYAAWLGYDAIDCKGTTPDTHMLVLNRTALLVDVRDYTAMGD